MNNLRMTEKKGILYYTAVWQSAAHTGFSTACLSTSMLVQNRRILAIFARACVYPCPQMSIEEVKTDAGRRQIHLSTRATEALRQHAIRQAEERAKADTDWRNNDLVFCTMTGGAIHKSNFRRRSFMKLVQAAGVPYIRPYDMRHTAATLLLLAGVHPKIVSEMLGHTSVTITLTIYSHVLPMIQRDAADAMNRLLGEEKGETEEPNEE